MKINKNILLNIIITVIQVLVLIPALVLEKLSDEKMGVMRYLVFKNRIYSQTTFSPSLIKIYTTTLICITIITFIAIVYYKVKFKNKNYSKGVISSIIIDIFVILFITNIKAMMLDAYYFFLIAFFGIIIIQYIRLIILNFNYKKLP